MFKNALIKGTFILTATGLITRLIGFFFRMFMSHSFGAEQVGLYQLIFPIYALCFSLSSAGIETALARCVAQKMTRGQKKEADLLLYQAIAISFSISLTLAFLINRFDTTLSIYILGDLRCEKLLGILSLSLPFASIHSCICGYYFGLKKTEVPALSQLIEQIARVASVYIIYVIYSEKGGNASIVIAVAGIAIGEACSMLFCIRHFSARKHYPLSLPSMFRCRDLAKDLTRLATPLTSNRVLMNVFQSIETISIPLSLQKSGLTNAEALSLYGILTGMALPCILFPTALTNSVSSVLLPTVAEIQAENRLVRLKQLIQKVILFGFGFGSVCGIGFLVFGTFIGRHLFNNSLAGSFIQTLAWICPFLYMNTTLMSILNGLGKANHSFFINICGLTIRILSVWFMIPIFSIRGYLWGLLGSQLLVSILCIWQLKRYIEKRELF